MGNEVDRATTPRTNNETIPTALALERIGISQGSAVVPLDVSRQHSTGSSRMKEMLAVSTRW